MIGLLVEPMKDPVTELPRPNAWWVQVRVVEGAPDLWIVHRNGEIWGYHVIEGVQVGTRFTEDDMRLYGYELCICDPWGNMLVPDPQCLAHAVR